MKIFSATIAIFNTCMIFKKAFYCWYLHLLNFFSFSHYWTLCKKQVKVNDGYVFYLHGLTFISCMNHQSILCFFKNALLPLYMYWFYKDIRIKLNLISAIQLHFKIIFKNLKNAFILNQLGQIVFQLVRP